MMHTFSLRTVCIVFSPLYLMVARVAPPGVATHFILRSETKQGAITDDTFRQRCAQFLPFYALSIECVRRFICLCIIFSSAAHCRRRHCFLAAFRAQDLSRDCCCCAAGTSHTNYSYPRARPPPQLAVPSFFCCSLWVHV